MYYLNKIVGFFFSPLVLAITAGMIGTVFAACGRRKFGCWAVAGALIWLWAWSTAVMYRLVGLGLEREWPIVLAEDSPPADAIVLLGGGIGSNTNVYPYAEMSGGSDRVWHAARLYKAGKAPIIIASGVEGRAAHLPLLIDLGVSESDVIFEDESRNTEENAKFVEKTMTDKVSGKPKVLLVTSVWHMRRSVLMFKRYAPQLEIIPAPTDYEATVSTGHAFSITELLPDVNMLGVNTRCLKEYIGYWGYVLFR